MAKSYCDYCEAELEPSREFVYEMESLNFLDDEEWLEEIRSVPAYPLRICKKCQASIDRNEADRKSEEPEEDYEQRGGFQLLAYAVILIALLIVGDIVISFFRSL